MMPIEPAPAGNWGDVVQLLVDNRHRLGPEADNASEQDIRRSAGRIYLVLFDVWCRAEQQQNHAALEAIDWFIQGMRTIHRRRLPGDQVH